MAFNNNFHPTATPTPALQVFRPPPPPTPTTTKKGKTCNFLSLFFVYILFSFNIDKAPTEKKSVVGGGCVEKRATEKNGEIFFNVTKYFYKIIKFSFCAVLFVANYF